MMTTNELIWAYLSRETSTDKEADSVVAVATVSGRYVDYHHGVVNLSKLDEKTVAQAEQMRVSLGISADVQVFVGACSSDSYFPSFVISGAERALIVLSKADYEAREDVRLFVIAHELSHIADRHNSIHCRVDRISTQSVLVLNSFVSLALFAHYFSMVGLAAVASFSLFTMAAKQLIMLKVMRGQEFEADHRAAKLVGFASGAAALRELYKGEVRSLTARQKSFRALVLCIERLLGTHPPYFDRVRALRKSRK